MKKRSAARVAWEFFTPKIWTDTISSILAGLIGVDSAAWRVGLRFREYPGERREEVDRQNDMVVERGRGLGETGPEGEREGVHLLLAPEFRDDPDEVVPAAVQIESGIGVPAIVKYFSLQCLSLIHI